MDKFTAVTYSTRDFILFYNEMTALAHGRSHSDGAASFDGGCTYATSSTDTAPSVSSWPNLPCECLTLVKQNQQALEAVGMICTIPLPGYWDLTQCTACMHLHLGRMQCRVCFRRHGSHAVAVEYQQQRRSPGHLHRCDHRGRCCCSDISCSCRRRVCPEQKTT